MLFKVRVVTRKVRPELVAFVESIWFFQSNLSHNRERVLPAGSNQILFNLEEDQLRAWRGDELNRLELVGGAALTAVCDQPFAIDTAQQRQVAGVAFRPGGAAAFFDVPMTAMGSMNQNLTDLWGSFGSSLRDGMLGLLHSDCPKTDHGVQNPEARIHRVLEFLELALLRRLTPPKDNDIDFAINALERGESVASVQKALQLSPRWFRRRFCRRVGMGPKRFARLRRFHGVIRAACNPREVDWGQLALQMGYCDQAHLVRDFRTFSGISPSRYAPRNANDPGHLVLE